MSDKDMITPGLLERDGYRLALPDLPNMPEARKFLTALKEAVETKLGTRGSPADRALTWRDLYQSGLAQVKLPNGTVVSGGGKGPFLPPPVPDNAIPDTTPATLTGFAVTGGYGVIFIEWDDFNRKTTAFVEVFANSVDNVATAVKIGESTSSIYVDRPGPIGTTRYFWARGVNGGPSALRGPFNAVGGTPGTVATDPSYILQLLSNQITSSQLAAALASRIDLIDAPGTTIGSVNQRIQQGDTLLAQQIATLSAGANQGFDPSVIWYFDSGLEGWTATNATLVAAAGWLSYTAPTGVVSLTGPVLATAINGSAYAVARLRIKRTGGAGWDVVLRWQEAGTWRSIAVPDPTLAAGETKSVSVDLSANANWAAKSITRLELQLNSAQITADIDWVAVGRDAPGASAAALQVEQQARVDGDAALASQVTTLQSTQGGQIAALQTAMSTRITNEGVLQAQYTVKVDVNGYVAGFGLASAAANGATTSSFIVRADKFSIASPSGPGITPITPFIVNTTPTTENGVAIPPGVYMDGAYIRNLTAAIARLGVAWIDDAKIANVSAGKITFGTMSGDRIASASADINRITSVQILASKIDTRGLDIRDLSGNIIFSSGAGGVKLDSSWITPSSAWLNANINIAPDGTITGIGSGSGTQVDNSKLVPSIQSAAQTANWTSIGGRPYFGGFSAVDYINSANISTYINQAAIDLALINKANVADLSALKATTGNLNVNGDLVMAPWSSGRILVYDPNSVLRVRIGRLT